MRKQILSRYLTRIRHEREGSITLEAALIMPLLLLFILFFYLLLMVVSAQMALQATASASVQQISAHLYPASLLVNQLNTPESQYESVEEGWKKIVYDLSDSFPAPVDQLVQEGLKGNWWPAINLAGTYIGKDIFEAYIHTNANYPILNKEKVELIYLQLPDLIHYTDQNVILTLEYELPLKIPLLNQAITIREQAMQRAWLPDARPANFKIGEEEAFIQIISLTPNPVRPGRKATLKVVTMPNTAIDLSIVYKSGNSVAKNLGVVTSDENGEVSWTWHVSGNTTEGEWQLKLSLPEQQYVLEQSFTVMKMK